MTVCVEGSSRRTFQ